MTIPPRRKFLQACGALGLALSNLRVFASGHRFPIADSHSHYGMLSSKLSGHTLKDRMLDAGVTLLSWKIIGDKKWTMNSNLGVQQRSNPLPGEQAGYFRERFDFVKAYLAKTGVNLVRIASDIGSARDGVPHVVMAVEGAGFVEDGLSLIDQFHAEGLRHLQLVHYIRNGLADIQTERPVHNGLTDLGVSVIKACNRLGILVDLAHATGEAIDRALDVSSSPMVWSHSDIATAHHGWQRSARLSRQIHVDYARKIARQGGAVGLWALRSSAASGPTAYADSLMRMADMIGPEHVMFGTDLDGVGKNAALDDLFDLREVVDILLSRGMDDKTLRGICFENYARCLGTALTTGESHKTG